MPTISFVSIEQYEALANEYEVLKSEVAELRALVQAYIATQEEWLSTAAALRTTGIKSRTTLIVHARASAPGTQELGRITYQKEGRKTLYLRSLLSWGAPTAPRPPALIALR